VDYSYTQVIHRLLITFIHKLFIGPTMNPDT
jgi:hypothetical protein